METKNVLRKICGNIKCLKENLWKHKTRSEQTYNVDKFDELFIANLMRHGGALGKQVCPESDLLPFGW